MNRKTLAAAFPVTIPVLMGYTVIAMLIVYCLKGVSFASPEGWVPSLLAGAAAVLLHLWKENDLVSIFGATAIYMTLIQGVFG